MLSGILLWWTKCSPNHSRKCSFNWLNSVSALLPFRRIQVPSESTCKGREGQYGEHWLVLAESAKVKSNTKDCIQVWLVTFFRHLEETLALPRISCVSQCCQPVCLWTKVAKVINGFNESFRKYWQQAKKLLITFWWWIWLIIAKENHIF